MLLWIDASAGVAGDMLLGALVDTGAPLPEMQRAVDAVVPGAVRLSTRTVSRAGLRATQVEVAVLVPDPLHRPWAAIRGLLEHADLPEPVRATATAAFARLAAAEGRVHGISPDQVHFHEVGALDAIADVVGTSAGVHALGATTVTVSPVAVGSGTVRAHHGELAVPVPAVLELARGRQVLAGGTGELATPTGMALVTELGGHGALPTMTVLANGVGAGTRDTPHRANVVRMVLGEALGAPASADAVLLETNVDDLDPRLWPGVLADLMTAGALDAWLTPILMKKGRPAHTLHVLGPSGSVGRLSDIVLTRTSTLGLRRTMVSRDVLDRTWTAVTVDGVEVRVKVGHRNGLVVQAMPEFDEVAALAAANGRPAADVLLDVRAAVHRAGLVPGRPVPGPAGG